MKKEKIKIIRNEKGIALLWSLVTISILLAIASSMTNLIIKESQLSTSISDSIGAYAAAESGIQHGLAIYKDQNYSGGPYTLNGKMLDPSDQNIKYDLKITKNSDTSYTIESIGYSGNTIRKIERTMDQSLNSQPKTGVYSSTSPVLTANATKTLYTHPINPFILTSNIDINNKNYKQTFLLDVTSAVPSGRSVAIGATNNNQGISVKFFSNGYSLVIGDPIDTYNTVDRPYTLTAGNKYRVYITYKKTVAQVRINRISYSSGAEVENCGDILTKNVPSALVLTNPFDKIFFYNSSGTSTSPGLAWDAATSELQFKNRAANLAGMFYMSLSIE
ncbi:MAG: hypothetical protein M1355_03315 [Patescibacteria group bacterium]|nr:hypothetical protein [Patescibacteria group bacterium]